MWLLCKSLGCLTARTSFDCSTWRSRSRDVSWKLSGRLCDAARCVNRFFATRADRSNQGEHGIIFGKFTSRVSSCRGIHNSDPATIRQRSERQVGIASKRFQCSSFHFFVMSTTSVQSKKHAEQSCRGAHVPFRICKLGLSPFDTSRSVHADTQRSWTSHRLPAIKSLDWNDRANQVSACQARALLKFPLERRILLVRLKVDTARGTTHKRY